MFDAGNTVSVCCCADNESVSKNQCKRLQSLNLVVFLTLKPKHFVCSNTTECFITPIQIVIPCHLWYTFLHKPSMKGSQMEHKFTRKKEGEGNMASLTPTCSCGWSGCPEYAYDDNQYQALHLQEKWHLHEAEGDSIEHQRYLD